MVCCIGEFLSYDFIGLLIGHILVIWHLLDLFRCYFMNNYCEVFIQRINVKEPLMSLLLV